MAKLTPSRRHFLGGVAASGLIGCKPAADGQPGGGKSPTEPDPSPGTDTATDTGPVVTTSRPPNILYIFSDQHRGDAWNKAGTPQVITPTLDALAAEGVSFVRMFTNGPSCRPGRYSMMTGRYVHDHNVWTNMVVGPSSIPNHVRDMRDAGYQTGVVGKTHLHDDNSHTSQTVWILEEFGFEYVHELVGQNEQVWHETPYSDWLSLTTPTGEVDKYDRYVDYTNAYDWFSPPPDADPWNLETIDHMDWYTAMHVADWLRTRQDDRPFYLQLNFPGPHKPFDSTTEFREIYDPSQLEPAILERPAEPISRLVQTLLDWKEEDFTAEESQEIKVSYYGKITLMDAALAMVIEALKEIGEYDNTWIIYSSDHGELLGDHHLTGKIAFYEGAIHVPLIIRPPGGVTPWVCEGMCDHLDLTATIREIGGLDNTDLPGVSLLSKVLGGEDAPGAQDGKPEIVAENMTCSMIRTNEFKLTYDAATSMIEELYDLVNDPDELVNLRDDPAYKPVMDDLLQRLLATGSPASM